MSPLCETTETMAFAVSSLGIPSEIAISSTKLRPGPKKFPRERGLYGESSANLARPRQAAPRLPEGGMGKTAEPGPV